MLSGGMDSGSIVATAADILARESRGPLRTFSVLGPDASACAETRAIRSASTIEGIEPCFINLEDIGPFRDELVELTRTQSDPFDWQMGLLRAVYLAAHRAGLKVVLDGVAGDIALTSGSYLARLLRAGKIGRAVREAVGEARFWGPDWPAWKSLASAVGRAWVPRPLRVARRRALWWIDDRRIGRTGLISPQFAARAGLRQRRQQLRNRDSWFDRLDARERVRHVEHARLIVARERYDRVASSVAVEPRDPFMDLRVIEFCLSLPWEQLQAGGWPKILLRRAMAGRLPDPVRWRRGKEHLGGEFTEKLFEPLDVSEFSACRLRETIAPYIHFSDSGSRPDERQGIEHCSDRMEAICLFYWLNRPSRPGPH
jgi:asparagine synthase (glutamine-hydrolysing)